jgi:arsenite methyltransferase
LEKEIKKNVREAYGKIAREGSSCCDSSSPCCGGKNSVMEQFGCCGANVINVESFSRQIGYSEEDLKKVPEEADLGLGCGNPVALASLKEGEVVLDLGSGPGMDCFLAANKIGKKGKVIGVDMTPDMLDRARQNVAKGNYTNVEFRLGEIENLPVADNYVDVVISNCVINLCPDKQKVFNEIYRVLKPGGRLMVSDMVLESELPESLKNSIEAYASCIAGASLKSDYLQAIKDVGLQDITVVGETTSYVHPSDFQTEEKCCSDKECCCGPSEDEIPIISLEVSAVKP